MEGGRGVVRGLARLIQDHPVGGFKGGGVVSKSHQGGEEVEYDRGVNKIDFCPHRVGDPIGPRSGGGGGFGDGEFNLILGEGGSGGVFG